MNTLKISCLALLILCSTATLIAQDNVETEGWEVIERCLSELPYPTIPQSNWNFDGMIIVENREGIRALRSDFDTSYFIALKSGNSFTTAGQFSPDGRWFAYALGDTQYMSMMWDRANINRLRVISTDSRGIYYDIPWFNWGNASNPFLDQLMWIDNEHFVYDGSPVPRTEQSNSGLWVINAFTGESEPMPVDFPLPITNQMRYMAGTDPKTISFEEVEGKGVFLKNKQGVETLILATDQSFVFGSLKISPDEAYALAYFNDNFHLIDINHEVVYNLCESDLLSYWSIWSPDSQSIAFLYDGYPVLYDIETQSMQILRFKTSQIIAWLPIESE